MPTHSVEYRTVFLALRHHGLLLESDPRLPCLTQIVAGEPMKGSWWGHPKGRLIFQVTRQVAAHPEVLVTKLVSGKVTFVHRNLWPALIAVATAREPWQTRKLSAAERSLLRMVTEEDFLRTDEPRTFPDSKPITMAARELERRLLVHSEQFHTDAGSHAKRLETWEHWAKRVGFSDKLPTVEQAKAAFEKIVTSLNQHSEGNGKLPWEAGPSIGKSS